HANPPRREIAGKGPRECSHTSLGCGVCGIAGLSQRANYRTIQNDRRSIVEIRKSVLYGKEDRRKVGVDHLTEELFRSLACGRVSGNARICEENVQLAELLPSLFERGLSCSRVCDLHFQRVHSGSKQLDCFIQGLLVATSDDNLCSFVDKE